MSEIIKTKAFILRKLNYSDSSLIAAFFTQELGKISAILKGARSTKSRLGTKTDVLNFVEIVLYQKMSRDLQVVSQMDLIAFYPKIKEDLEKYKYASAVLELTDKLTAEHEVNDRLFRGISRILELLDTSSHDPPLLFIKFFIFILGEIGYALQFSKCSKCGKIIKGKEISSYNFSTGIICKDCRIESAISYDFTPELFKIIHCLINNKNDNSYKKSDVNKLIYFLENYLIYHLPEFKGIKAIHAFL